MKILPCTNCGQARLREGLYYLQRWPGGKVLRYVCQCKTSNAIDQADWAKLPSQPGQELERLGIVNWRRLELTAQEQADLCRAPFNFKAGDVWEMMRK